MVPWKRAAKTYEGTFTVVVGEVNGDNIITRAIFKNPITVKNGETLFISYTGTVDDFYLTDNQGNTYVRERLGRPGIGDC